MEQINLDSSDIYQRMYEREKLARQSAEALIEKKTREIYLANLELKKSNARLTSASKAKSYFLRQIAHDLRTPINWISVSSQLLQQELPSESKALSRSQAISQHCDVLNTQVSRLLELFNMLDPYSQMGRTSYTDIIEKMKNFKPDIGQSSHYEIRFQDPLEVADEALEFSFNIDSISFFVHLLCNELLMRTPVSERVLCEIGISSKSHLQIKFVSKGFSYMRITKAGLELLSSAADKVTEQNHVTDGSAFETLFYLAQSNDWEVCGESSGGMPDAEYDSILISIPPVNGEREV